MWDIVVAINESWEDDFDVRLMAWLLPSNVSYVKPCKSEAVSYVLGVTCISILAWE